MYSLYEERQKFHKMGEGAVGFLFRDCSVNEVEFVDKTRHAEHVWIQLRGERGKSALWIGCLYMY